MLTLSLSQFYLFQIDEISSTTTDDDETSPRTGNSRVPRTTVGWSEMVNNRQRLRDRSGESSCQQRKPTTLHHGRRSRRRPWVHHNARSTHQHHLSIMCTRRMDSQLVGGTKESLCSFFQQNPSQNKNGDLSDPRRKSTGLVLGCQSERCCEGSCLDLGYKGSRGKFQHIRSSSASSVVQPWSSYYYQVQCNGYAFTTKQQQSLVQAASTQQLSGHFIPFLLRVFSYGEGIGGNAQDDDGGCNISE